MGGYCLQGQPDKANELLDLMAGEGLKPDRVSYAVIIDGYCKNKKVDRAWEIFEGMRHKGLKPDVCVYSIMIQGLFCVGRSEDALKLFDDMKTVGLVANSYTYCIVLDGLLNNGRIDDATLFYYEVMDYHTHPTIANSTLVELTSRLDFFKERRSQLMEQLHNLDLNYGTTAQEFHY
ncbi:hypothetical protein LIER_36121 [Lithospermum erythrorhizon]|uniref:Pentatricopeptide repeat-containing protein n=1 Tax=Lithospermum erythrorhizon TaxID=34254 RepID=A0AAV3P2Q5_LITER